MQATSNYSQEIIDAIGQSEFDRIIALANDELLDEFGRATDDLKTVIARLVVLVGEMDRRKIDLSGLPMGDISWLRRIAAGQADFGCAVRLWGCSIFRNAIDLPLSEQKHIAAGGKIDLVVMRDNGPAILRADPVKFQPRQVQQVFGRKGIRSADEQVLWIEEQKSKQVNEEDDAFDQAEQAKRIVMPVAFWKKLAKKARETGRTESEIIMDALRARRVV